MRNIRTSVQIIMLTLCIFHSSGFSQVFVNHAAMGSNDGTSWDNAYTDLSMALISAQPGDEVWVAQGTYHPGGSVPSREAFFRFSVDVALYGGFDGSETMRSQRDPVTNLTILSGDLDGDDIPGDFNSNKSDNTKHVIWLESGITNASIIDGFVISGGHTEPSTSSGEDRRGGGILTYGAPIISNCIFTNNYGHFGGGLYPRGSGATGIIVENCLFEQNQGGFGGGIYMNSTTGTVRNCRFVENESLNSGAGMYSGCASGCTIEDSEFTNNESNARGGGIYNSSSPSTIMNCTFNQNSASSSTGGGIHITTFDGDPASQVQIANCSFTGGDATWGGAISTYGERTEVTVNGCQISQNTAVNNGGGCHNGFNAHVRYIDCMISENEANRGGAFNSQNDSVVIQINNCSVLENSSGTNGGAMTIVSDSDPMANLPLVTLDKVIMSGNICGEQGGAVDISNANLTVINSSISENFNTGLGAGGAISFNASDSFSIVLSMLNSTIALNFAQIGAGVSLWEGALGTATMVTQNTIFHNPDGSNYEIEDGIPEVISDGGNLSSDDSFFELTGPNDTNEESPGFVDEFGGDYRLMDSSPAVNSGISQNAPDTDLHGNPRVGEIDKGAYENQNVTSLKEVNKDFGALVVTPLGEDRVKFDFHSDYTGPLDFLVRDMNGKMIWRKEYDKQVSQLQDQFILDVVSGVYILTVENDRFRQSRAFRLSH